MVENALLVFALCTQYFEADHVLVSGYLRDFRGTWRRMEEKGRTEGGAIIVDDYAHHPVEIRATVNAMREKYPDRRLICVFQPHMRDRTRHFYQEFTTVILGVRVLLTDIYEARRERSDEVVNMGQFARDIQRGSRVACEYVGSLSDAERKLRDMLHSDHLVLCMGAGDITELAARMVQPARCVGTSRESL